MPIDKDLKLLRTISESAIVCGQMTKTRKRRSTEAWKKNRFLRYILAGMIGGKKLQRKRICIFESKCIRDRRKRDT